MWGLIFPLGVELFKGYYFGGDSCDFIDDLINKPISSYVKKT